MPDMANVNRVRNRKFITPLVINKFIIKNGIRGIETKGDSLVCIDPSVLKVNLEKGFNITITDMDSAIFMASVCEYLISEIADSAFKYRNTSRTKSSISKADVINALQTDTELNLIQIHLREKREAEKEGLIVKKKSKAQTQVRQRMVAAKHQYTYASRETPFYLSDTTYPSNARKRTRILLSDLAAVARQRSPDDIYYRNRVSLTQIFEIDMWKDDHVRDLASKLFGGLVQASEIVRGIPDDNLGYNTSNDQFALTFSRGGDKVGLPLRRLVIYFSMADASGSPVIIDVATSLEDPSVANAIRYPGFIWISMYRFLSPNVTQVRPREKRQQQSDRSSALTTTHRASQIAVRDRVFFLEATNRQHTPIPLADLLSICRSYPKSKITYRKYKSIADIFRINVWNNAYVQNGASKLFGGTAQAAKVVRGIPDNRLGYDSFNDQFILTFTRSKQPDTRPTSTLVVKFTIPDAVSFNPMVVDVATSIEDASVVSNVYKNPKILWIPMDNGRLIQQE
jgi:hypothetical protein